MVSTRVLRHVIREGVSQTPDGNFDLNFDSDSDVDVVQLTRNDTKRPDSSGKLIQYAAYIIRDEQPGADEFKRVIKGMNVDRMQDKRLLPDEKYGFEQLLDKAAERFLDKVGINSFALTITAHGLGTHAPLCNHLVASLQLLADTGPILRGGTLKKAMGRVDHMGLWAGLARYSPQRREAYFRAAQKNVARAATPEGFKMRKVLGNWRKYVYDFLELSPEVKEALKAADAGKPVLFVDDIKTTGSTSQEVARLIWEVAPDAQVVAFTMAKSFKRHS